MSQKTTAQLLIDNNAVVTSQTAPESITPTTLGALLLDMIESMYNREDDAPLVMPACFTGIVAPGDSANKLFQALLDKTCFIQTQVQGGVQGLPGEFLANITSDTNQNIKLEAADLGTIVASVKFPNDKDNGSFDNGNNFLIHKFVVPTGGQPSVQFTASGLIIQLIENTLSVASAINLQFEIHKNGTLIGTSISNAILIDDTTVVDTKFYFNDFDTGLIAVIAGDVITVELNLDSGAIGGSTYAVIKLNNGFFNNELP